MVSDPHPLRRANRDFGRLTPREWGKLLDEAAALSLVHNTEQTANDCQRCIYLDKRAAEMLAARGVTVGG